MTARHLKPVPTEPPPVVDIYASWKAEIASRDWARCHIAGDRSPAVDLPDHNRKGWLK